MKKNNNNNNKSSRKARGQFRTQELISHPLQLDGSQLRHSTRVRFKSTAAATLAVTFQNLLDSYLVATTAVAGSQVFQTVKVREVEIWGIPAIGAAPQPVVCEFSGITTGIVGDQQIHSDSPMGVQPAHIRCRPSARSLAADYQLSSAAVAFTITVPAGAVIDVALTFRGQFAAANAVANALAGATAGAFYLRGLDGLATAGTNFPVELFTAGYQI